MVSDPPTDILKDHFRGALLGCMIGDALGMAVEGFSVLDIRLQYNAVVDMISARRGRGTYTDDTEMMIGLAEGLLESPGKLDLDKLASCFCNNFTPARGYGENAGKILSAMTNGMHWRKAVQTYAFPEGSYANGAAMRVAPVALAFFNDTGKILQAAAHQAEITGHTHPVGRQGACLMALAIHGALILGSQNKDIEPRAFLAGLKAIETHQNSSQTISFKEAIDWIEENLSASPEEAILQLGTSAVASSSVSIALWSFLSIPRDPEAAILRAVNLGGDTDTIGAMTGALAGAYHGALALPERWVKVLEDGDKGKRYVLSLADRLLELGTAQEKT